MTTDERDVVRTVLRQIGDEAPDPIAFEELHTADIAVQQLGKTRMRTRPLAVATTVAAAILVVIGGTAVLTDRDTAVYLADGEELLATEPPMVLGAESPNPEFDTSTLGLESPLAPLGLATVQNEIARYQADGEILRVTIIGETPEGFSSFVVHAEVDDPDLGSLQTRCIYTTPGGSSCAGIEVEEAAEFPGGLIPADTKGGLTYSAGEQPTEVGLLWDVPSNTSIVTLTVNGETRWQRPIANVAVFVTALTYGDQFELVALGTEGNILMSATQTVTEDG